MKNEMRNTTGGGVFLALGTAIGVFVGRLYSQTSIGLIVGVAIGAGIAALIWWRERNRG